MQRLVGATPEPLVSRFRVTADLVASVLGRPDGPAALKHLLRTNHDTDQRKRHHRKRAIAVYRSLGPPGWPSGFAMPTVGAPGCASGRWWKATTNGPRCGSRRR
ncbi:MAG: DUF3516 domain-containing protein [Ilumatobacteraceae bacterium]